MAAFDSVFFTPPCIRIGKGLARRLGELVQALGVRKVMLVTDPCVASLKLHEPAVASLAAEAITVAVYDTVIADPPLSQALELRELLQKDAPDLVIGFGGGSAIDLAKIAAIMARNEGDLRDFVGVNLVPRPGLPTLFIPTTAGTGSEATHIGILNDVERQLKIGIVSEYMFTKHVVLDPELTLTLPPQTTCWTGLDALIHAIESYVSRAATPITEALAIRAMELISRHLRKAYAVGSNMEAREGMLIASLLAGMAFSNTQCGGAHACALAVGARCRLAHGLATTLMLPAVMEFNLIAAPEKYRHIAEIFGRDTRGMSLYAGAAESIRAVTDLAKSMDFVFGLEHYGASPDHIPALAERCLPPARLWNSNPRTADMLQVTRILERSFGDWPKESDFTRHYR